MKKFIALILAALMCVCFAACGGNTEETVAVTTGEAVSAPEAGTLEAAVYEVETLLAALKAGDEETIIALGGSDAIRSDDLLRQMLVAMFSKLDYTVGEAKDNGDGTATLPVEISAVSITSVFTEYMAEAAKHIDEEEWDADGSYFIELCSSDKVAKDTKSVTVNIENKDGAWAVAKENSEFIGALFGGLIEG